MPLGDPDPIKLYSEGEFTAPELERIRDIVLADALSTVENVVDELTPSQRQATRYDIDLYINEVGEGTVAVQGGSRGVDYKQVRDRNAIRVRVAQRLGLPIPALSGGLFRIPVVSDYGCDEDY